MGLEGDHRVPARRDVAVAYMIFDVLYLDDTSLVQSRMSGNASNWKACGWKRTTGRSRPP